MEISSEHRTHTCHSTSRYFTHHIYLCFHFDLKNYARDKSWKRSQRFCRNARRRKERKKKRKKGRKMLFLTFKTLRATDAPSLLCFIWNPRNSDCARRIVPAVVANGKTCQNGKLVIALGPECNRFLEIGIGDRWRGYTHTHTHRRRKKVGVYTSRFTKGAKREEAGCW